MISLITNELLISITNKIIFVVGVCQEDRLRTAVGKYISVGKSIEWVDI